MQVLQLSEWAPPPPLSQLYPPWREARAHSRSLLEEMDGIRIHHPVVVTPRPSRFFPEHPWMRESRSLIKFCMRRRDLASADVVVGHFMVPDGLHALHLGRALGLPVAAVAWGDDVHIWPERSPLWRAGLVEVLEGVDLPIACSQRLVMDGNAWLKSPRNDWEVVYGGVDLERFNPERSRAAARSVLLEQVAVTLPSDSLIMLMVGQPVVEKGYLELLDAWTALAPMNPQWHLVMIGGAGPLDVRSMLRDRNLAARAHWIGMQPAERMPDIMRSADGFVLPSHNEGLSLSVLEALATGLPTIATAVGGHAEVIDSEEEGWLIPPRNEPSLRAALHQLMTREDERKRRGLGGARAARRIGSPRDNSARLLQLLRKLTDRAPRLQAVAT